MKNVPPDRSQPRTAQQPPESAYPSSGHVAGAAALAMVKGGAKAVRDKVVDAARSRKRGKVPRH